MSDERMEALAAAQHGVVTHRQAREIGLSESAIRHRRRQGRLRDVRRRVYRLSGAVETPRLRALAAVLAAGAGAVLSHRSAAGLHGLPGFDLEPITVSIPRARRSLAGVRLEQSLLIAGHHRRVVDAIPCTSVARTVFDLCGDVHPRRAERALDTAIARRLVTLPALWRVLDDLAEHGRAGTVLMRALLTERSAGYVAPASELEAHFLELVRRHGLPEPDRQVDLGDADTWIGRVDFVWPAAALVVEVDGAAYHDGFLDRRHDEHRDARLVRDGWTVMRFRWSDVVDRAADVAAGVAAAIRFRGANASAVSAGGCNEVGECLGWFHPVEGLSRPVVELAGDGVEVGFGVHGEVGAFGHPLAQEAVGVLVRAALPGGVRVAEVDLHAGVDRELAVLGELAALVPGDGPHEGGRKSLDLGGHRGANELGGVTVGKMQQHHEPSRSLDESADCGAVVLADEQVAFPVAGHGPVFDLSGPFRDHHLVGNVPAGLEPRPVAADRAAGAQTRREFLA
jgi:very-short-patch-repair endonuclease